MRSTPSHALVALVGLGLSLGTACRADREVPGPSVGASRSSDPGAELRDDRDVLVLTAEARLAGLVNEEGMAQRVRELVGLGSRMGGTASGLRAVELREAAFRAIGLDVVRIEGAEQWCHEEPSFSLRAHIDGVVVPLDHAWPYGFSPTAAGRTRLSLEPRAGEALLSKRPPRRRETDADVAVRLVDGSTTPDGSWPVARTVRRGIAYPVFALSRDEGALLRDALDVGSEVEVEFEIESTITRARPITVVASLAAREGAPPGYFLFCAHGDSDSGGPGANDNGSGEAIVLEIARVWSRAIGKGLVPAPAREVRFAIWGTEIASTRDFLARHLKRIEEDGPLLGVVNYDQAGFGSGAEQLNVEPDDVPANAAFVRTVVALLEDHSRTPGFPPRWATNKSLGGTDSYVFSKAESFVAGEHPAVTLFTSAWATGAEHARTPGMPGESWSDRDVVSIDYDNYYHSAGDLPRNTTDLEPWNMGWCARVGLLAAIRWLEGLSR